MMVVLQFLAALLAGHAPEAQELSEENFASWYSAILPKDQDVAWREIPWRGTLWEGVAEARRTDRPVLFWAMNGHPLDCT